MPIYEYQCAGCGHRLEAIQRFSDAPLKQCPDCGRAKLKKLISAAGFRLGGKGWYETDFKKDKQRNLSQRESAEEKKSEKSNGSGDAKKSSSTKDKDSKAAKSGSSTASAAVSSS